MLWDILVSLGIFVTQLVLTWYGIHVSVTEHRIRNAFIIGFVGCVGLLLTIFGTIRSSTAQQTLQSQIDKIEKHTETPPQITVNPTPVTFNAPPAQPSRANVSLHHLESAIHLTQNGVVTERTTWLQPGQDIEANVYFTNQGPETADKAWGFGEIYLMPSDSSKPEIEKLDEKKKDMQVLIPRFKKALAKLTPNGIEGTIANDGHSQTWYTAHSERVITQDDLNKLQNGSELLFLFFSEQYSDPAGQHYIHSCRSAQTPAFNPEVWQYCPGFQEHR